MVSTISTKALNRLNEFKQDLLAANDENGSNIFKKWDLGNTVDRPLKAMLKKPVRLIKDDHQREVGYVIFDHYKVVQDQETHDLQLMINFNTYRTVHKGYKNYNYPFSHKFLIGETQRADDFQWIMDIELTHSSRGFNSHIWIKSKYMHTLSYLEVAVLIKFAVAFGLLSTVNHRLLNDYEQVKRFYVHNEERRIRELSASGIESENVLTGIDGLAHVMYLFYEFWKRNTSLKVGEYNTITWDTIQSRNIKDRLNYLLLNKWGVWFKYQTNNLRLSDFIYFKQRHNPYLKDILRVEAYSSAQLFYLFNIDQRPESFADLNYFSYQNKLSGFSEKMYQSFLFPTKRSLRRFNALNANYLIFWLQHRVSSRGRFTGTEISKKKELSDTEILDLYIKEKNRATYKYWQGLMYMLTYCENIGKFEDTASNRVITLINMANFQDFEKHGEDLARCFDLIYRHHEELEKRYDVAIEEVTERYNLAEIDRDKFIEESENLDNQKWAFLGEVDDYLIAKDKDGNLEHVAEINSKTTYTSVHRKVDEWHEKLNKESLEQLKKENKVKSFKHINPRKQTQGKSILIPLKTNLDVLKEGVEQKHCIKTYLDIIEKGEYCAYRMIRDKEQATLGIRFRQESEYPYSFDQCFGKRNGVVSSDMRKDANDFVGKLNHAYRKKHGLVEV